jgi:DNA polymerase III delta prime subunit
MKHLNKITLAVLLLAAFDMVGSLNATKSPNIDEIDALIAKSSKNMAMAGTVVQAAAKAQEKTLSQVVNSINEMKEENVKSKAKLNIFTKRMMVFGVDTIATPEDPTYLKAYKDYKDNGGEQEYQEWKQWMLNELK